MPPQQCPSCGRFLKAALVASLVTESADCPGCESALSVGDFAPTGNGSTATDALDGVGDAGHPGGAEPMPGGVVDDVVAPTDVLEGWDPEGPPSRWLDDQPPFPVDTAVVAGATVAGAVVGAFCAPRRALRGAIVGAVLGAVGAAVSRRIWELND